VCSCIDVMSDLLCGVVYFFISDRLLQYGTVQRTMYSNSSHSKHDRYC